jgi:hypothetical protein
VKVVGKENDRSATDAGLYHMLATCMLCIDEFSALCAVQRQQPLQNERMIISETYQKGRSIDISASYKSDTVVLCNSNAMRSSLRPHSTTHKMNGL